MHNCVVTSVIPRDVTFDLSSKELSFTIKRNENYSQSHLVKRCTNANANRKISKSLGVPQC